MSEEKTEGRPKTLFVGIADIKFGHSPQNIKTNLGSCIAVCLYAPNKKIGGMLHLMLASSKMELDSQKSNIKKAKYADTGIPELIALLSKEYKITCKDLVAKIFGGARVLANVSTNIGEDNEKAVRTTLEQNGIKIIAAKLGGTKGYNVDFDLESGKVRCQVFGEPVTEI